MSIHDDDQFERYLKQFQPVEPEPLVVKEKARVRRRPLIFVAWAAAAAILVAVMISTLLHKPAQPAKEVTASRPIVLEWSNPEPLTVESANALLARAPSFKAAVDDMAFRPESKPISQGRYSALALLSREEGRQ